MKPLSIRKTFLFFLLSIFLSGCMGNAVLETRPTPQLATQALPTLPSATQTTLPSATASATQKAVSLTDFGLWISPAVPPPLREQIARAVHVPLVGSIDQANLRFDVLTMEAEGKPVVIGSSWVYALVAPFPSLMDGITFEQLLAAWNGKPADSLKDTPILMDESTFQAFRAAWGSPGKAVVQVLPSGELLDSAWEHQPTLAIVPFDALEPRWKVITVGGISPLNKQADLKDYGLQLTFGLTGDTEAIQALISLDGLDREEVPESNRDVDQMTELLMTGTTALVRNTALKMEEKGIRYPAEDILVWLQHADLLHVSNEVAFAEDCPPAVPLRSEIRFCSSPAYMDLLTYIHANVIELTGNHVLDYGVEDFRKTLALYKENHMPYYGGGENLEESRKALLIENHGNKLAFLGCNAVGPQDTLAREDQPGAAPCDMDALEAQIKDLRGQGYLPIVTFQHFEFYLFDGYKPQSAQRVDFQRMAKAGAVIVSGSQAHYPQAMTFVDGNFVHYGLGNLFFDQMEAENRPAFIDRHIFYRGRYISTDLLTTELEDYARPRPMNVDERKELLTLIFGASEW